MNTPISSRIAREEDVLFLLYRLKRHRPVAYRRSLTVASLFELTIAQEQLQQQDIDIAVRSALLHDIGYLHLVDEYSSIEKHPELGCELIEHVGLEHKIDHDMILYHHENLDGTGYPYGVGERGLSRNARMLRIISFLDEYTEGSYAASRTQSAIEELYRWSDVMFDESLVLTLHETMKFQSKGGLRWQGLQ
jgi:putative nucleotidyltransferase with HDIG domain